MTKTGQIRTGIAGWVFEGWRGGAFYPEGLKQKDELGFAGKTLTSIEINGTFYGNQKPASFENWAAQVPEEFVFSVKGHQLVTHLKKLNDVEIPLANFFASGVLALGKKLGPICWQLPGNLGFNPEKMDAFFKLLPKDPAAASKLAKKHDTRLKDVPFTTTDGIAVIRHAVEVRHKSFADAKFIGLLKTHNVALVTADTADWPSYDQTADFSYCRLQGAPGKERYQKADLDRWAVRIKGWAEGRPMTDGMFIVPPEARPKARDVLAYFVSTDKEHAPANAMALASRLGVAPQR